MVTETDTRPRPTASSEGAGSHEKLICRNVWKVFGRNAGEFLRAANYDTTYESLQANGFIGAVLDVSLEVSEGEIFVIMGLSGSGKSTLVRCMSRLIEPTAGEILFEGRNLLEASQRELIDLRRHKMGMVFQHFALYPHLTALGNVLFPLEVQGIERARRDSRAREMIELVGLKGREEYYPRELSGGQQQRVGLARSLAVEPEIWFLDEPFSALDPLIRREMQNEFLRLQRLLKKTIIFITHDFDEAIRLADRIAIMKEGQVIQVGMAEELVINPASDYVAEFTQDVNRAKVLSVGSVMSAGATRDDSATPCVGSVTVSDRIAEVAEEVLQAEGPFVVVDGDGREVGILTQKAVIASLVDKADVGNGRRVGDTAG